MLAPSASITREHPGWRPLRHEHPQRPVGALGQRRRGHGRVAARGDRQRWPPAGDEAERLGGAQVQQDPGEVTALVAATDVAGLVLDPHRRRCASAQIEVVGGERGDREAVADLAGEGDERRLGHPVGRAERPPRHPRAVGDERVGIVESAGWRPAGPTSGWSTWRRSRGDERGQVNGCGVATSTVVPHTAQRHPSTAPSTRIHPAATAPLKSAIIASHTSR